MIDYNTFLALAQQADVQALSYMAMNQIVKTPDAEEANGIQQQCQRLYDAGLCISYTRTLERVQDTDWHVFQGRIDPVGATYLAQCAAERLTLSREPLPPA